MFGFKSKTEEAAQAARPGLFKRLREKLNRGDSWLTYDLANLLPAGRIDDTVLDELETRLITADVGVETTERILDELRRKVARKELGDLDALLAALRSSLLDILQPSAAAADDRAQCHAVRDSRRRRQRRGQDHDDRQAGAAAETGRSEGHARRRRHIPRSGGRAAADLGQIATT